MSGGPLALGSAVRGGQFKGGDFSGDYSRKYGIFMFLTNTYTCTFCVGAIETLQLYIQALYILLELCGFDLTCNLEIGIKLLYSFSAS